MAAIAQHIVVQNETLCWGLWADNKRRIARVRNLGWMVIKFDDDAPIMVAESHLYEPSKPSLTIIEEVIAYIASRSVNRIGWADKWRPTDNGDPLRWDIIDSKGANLETVHDAISRAGVTDGQLNGQDPYDVKDRIERILNGISFGS